MDEEEIQREVVSKIADAISLGVFGKSIKSCGKELQKKIVGAACGVVMCISELSDKYDKAKK